MVIAVVAVRVMQVAADDVVDVIAVLHRLVAAVRAMLVLCVVVFAVVFGRAVVGVALGDRDRAGFAHVWRSSQVTMRISRWVLLRRRPPSSVATTMSSIRTPKRCGR